MDSISLFLKIKVQSQSLVKYQTPESFRTTVGKKCIQIIRLGGFGSHQGTLCQPVVREQCNEMHNMKKFCGKIRPLTTARKTSYQYIEYIFYFVCVAHL